MNICKVLKEHAACSCYVRVSLVYIHSQVAISREGHCFTISMHGDHVSGSCITISHLQVSPWQLCNCNVAPSRFMYMELSIDKKNTRRTCKMSGAHLATWYSCGSIIALISAENCARSKDARGSIKVARNCRGAYCPHPAFPAWTRRCTPLQWLSGCRCWTAALRGER